MRVSPEGIWVDWMLCVNIHITLRNNVRVQDGLHLKLIVCGLERASKSMFCFVHGIIVHLSSVVSLMARCWLKSMLLSREERKNWLSRVCASMSIHRKANAMIDMSVMTVQVMSF